jgi:hypothetical protein
MTELTLTRKQVEKLVEIVEHFKEVQNFTVTVESISGIGPTISVKFDLTDVETW